MQTPRTLLPASALKPHSSHVELHEQQMFRKSMALSGNSSTCILLLFLAILALFSANCDADAHAVNRVLSKEEGGGGGGGWGSGHLVKREERRSVVSTEYGEISDVRIRDDVNGGSYLIQFFTLEAVSLFLPVILHADMVFYVHSGRGELSWTDEDDLKRTHIKQGDAYRLEQGSVFFVRSSNETDQAEPQKLRIHAIFANSEEDLREPATGPYSSIRDMILGFHRGVLQATFQVSDEVIEELLSGTKPPAIVPGIKQSESKKTSWEIEERYITSLLSGRSYNIFESNKKKKRKEGAKLFNLLEEEKDFENCNGWSTTVTKKKLSALKGSKFGLFMVNLTEGSMMSPHWNPTATEIAIALRGQGMIRLVCSSLYNDTECQKMSFKVDEGDVFLVPRFHSMVQMAFNNDTFVFVGFSTSTKKNHPQFLAGQASVLRVLDKDVLAASFNSTGETIDKFVASKGDSVILKCTSCAEEEFWKMGEGEREREEERRKREEEEERQREQKEQEEERKKEEEEEEERKKQEEEEERQREQKEQEERERKEEAERQREQKEQEEEEEERRKREEEEQRQREQKEQEEEREKEEEEERQREQQREQEEEREKEGGGGGEEEEEERQREQQGEQEEEREKEGGGGGEEEEEPGSSRGVELPVLKHHKVPKITNGRGFQRSY